METVLIHLGGWEGYWEGMHLAGVDITIRLWSYAEHGLRELGGPAWEFLRLP